MAYGMIGNPGTRNGPCFKKDCGHTDCAATRALVASPCLYCGEPIGYRTKFVYVGQGQAHWACDMDAAERERKEKGFVTDTKE